ncbi:MAG: rRNA maturation RNase YbeY [Deltaproteobacteria bacterium]|nr:rRNA maturation RNase YbeY [Deltaproteobacteria bacterium]
MALYITDRQTRAKVELKTLHRLLAPVLDALDVVDLDLEIELLDDRQIAELNEKFFSRPWPTNVISFPQEKEAGHLGDIVVSVETAGRETAPLGYNIAEGIVYYLIHGILHLLGFEHVGVAAAEAAAMEQRQDELFELALSVAPGLL